MSTTDAVVYIVQEPPVFGAGGTSRVKDFSSAQRYGRLEQILGPTESASLAPGHALNRMKKALHGFRRGVDYVCFAGGDPMALSVALLALRDMNFKDVEMLRWDRERDTSGRRTQGGFYVPVTVPLY